MGNMICSALMLIFLVSSFRFSYVTMGVNRVFLGLFGGAAESAVVVYKASAELDVPHFYVPYFKAAVNTYLADNLTRYAPNYDTSFYFRYKRVSGVRLAIEASVTLIVQDYFINFVQTATFRVVEGD